MSIISLKSLRLSKTKTFKENYDMANEKDCVGNQCRCSDYIEELSSKNQLLADRLAENEKIRAECKYSETKFRKIFEYAPFGAAMAGKGGRILLANKALCDMLGYKKEELESMSFADFTHPEDVEMNMDLFVKLKTQQINHYHMKKRYLRKNNEIVWGSLAVALVKETASNEMIVIGMIENITKQKQIEDELKKHKEDLEKIVAERTKEITRLKDRLQAENTFLKEELEKMDKYGSIIGKSRPIKNVIEQIELVAPTKSNVLIQGESGTGKELVAREIHRHSSRSNQPFVKVNCAAIPEELYESEFFGHVKGAFTGAVKDRSGRFEAAHQGTIFLDEIGEIPLSVQSKLLRVLQESEYERLGEEKTRKVDVRVIAATNRTLKDEIENKKFREDLYYRLNVFPITVPPLRDRIDDIPLLSLFFVNKITEEMNFQKTELSKANILDLQSYDWPGNVRELENYLERALILSRSKKFDFSDLLKLDQRSSAKENVSSKPHYSKGIFSQNDIRQLERENMIKALKHSNWKIYGKSGASELLGIKPTTLIERMKRAGIRKP